MNGYKIKGKEEFYNKIIMASEKELDEVIKNKADAYRVYNKQKKNGIRKIYSIENEHPLYVIQKNVQNNFFSNFLFPDCVCGFIKYSSYFSFLTPHINKEKERYYLRLDIVDFFGSIKERYIDEALNYYFINEIDADEKNRIINRLYEIMTVEDKVVQGAVTSPTLSNLVFRELDIRIERYCQKIGVIYTRYADDMLFSCKTNLIHKNKFINVIREILNSKDFNINNNKTLRFKDEISLNGYVVGENIRLSRSKLHKINKIIFNMSKKDFNGFDSRKSKYKAKNILAGYRAFLIQAIRYIDDFQIEKQLQKKIKNIEKLILKYCAE